MANIPVPDFPVWGLLPKKETGVTEFLSKYPEYDGRGIIVAIFDSGIDPGAPGLQQTSDGKVKILQRFDCSGCGDVHTTAVTPQDGYITGLTGRKLLIPADWQNPTDKFRVGVKNAFDLYPQKVKERIKAYYKEKKWDEGHRKATAEATREMSLFQNKLTNVQYPSEVQKLEKEDLQAKVEFLANLEKKYSDLGPTYDCVVFHDGTKFMCCIDTSEKGDLAKGPLLGEYSKTHQYVPLTPEDQLNISVNVYDSGKVVEIVGLCSSHGTHVAAIAGAYFPDAPEKCGIAPGCQFISLTIGDGRLGSMETGTAMVRAMSKVMELEKTTPVHVINMSYGEHTHWSNSGSVVQLMTEVVNKYGIIWVAAAGNHGPALSTVNTPPDIGQDTIIGVGAYVSPEMMLSEYALRQAIPGMPYTWSSRGPTIDGSFGISICAPGGAITSMPNCVLRNTQLMNGTSMAAPHVAGAIAVIVSGLEVQKLAYSPYQVKRALENTAQFIADADPFAQGNGLLQVEKAYDYLCANHEVPEVNIRFHITCGRDAFSSVPHDKKGIYLRASYFNTVHEFNVRVDPTFLRCIDVSPDLKNQFDLKTVLVCDASYVSHPRHLHFSYQQRSFSIKIDTKDLPPGVHNTQIKGFDSKDVRRGPVFRIPVTIIQPEEVKPPNTTFTYQNVLFKPNRIVRHFYLVPNNCTMVTVRATLANQGTGRFVFHGMQIVPDRSCRSLDFNKTFQLTGTAFSRVAFKVRGGFILELVVAKYWADAGEVLLNYEVDFLGMKPDQPSVTMHAGNGIHMIEVTTQQGETVAPEITLQHAVQVLRPTESKVSPLTARDIIPPSTHIYELLLVYSFHLLKGTEVTPNSALLSSTLYESEFQSQLWMLFDANKQLMGCGDAYPSKYSVKLEKGDYTIRMQIRNDRKEVLEKLLDLPILLLQKLSQSVNLEIYSSYSAAITHKDKRMCTEPEINSNVVPCYVSPLTSQATEKIVAKGNNPGHYLLGNITFTPDDSLKKVDQYQFKYILVEPMKKPTKKEKEKPKTEEYAEALKELKTTWLAKMDVPEAANSLYEELQKDYPDHLAVHTAFLQAVDPLEMRRQLPPLSAEEIEKIDVEPIKKFIEVADVVMKKTDIDTLMIHFATKCDLRPEAPKIKITMEKQRVIFLEAMCRKGIYLCKLYMVEPNEPLWTEIADMWRLVVKYVDFNDKSNNLIPLYFGVWHAAAAKQYGRLLKYFSRLQEEKPCIEVEKKTIEICMLLGWDYLADYLRRQLPSKYPVAYRPF